MLVASAALSITASSASAAGDSMDSGRGHELARAWCSECHQVERNRKSQPVWDIPSFTSVARSPATTESSLRAFLSTPHPSMPNIKLKPAEIDEIVSYILSLKQPR